MLHPDSSTAAARPRRMIAAVLACAIVSLLVLAAPFGVAAKGPSITISADQQTVKAGDQVTLKIKLQNVTNATLNGAALPAGKDQVDKKVVVCATTTYTVAAMPKDGGSKISQALTITANGTSTKAACLPDLAVTGLTLSQSPDPQNTTYELVRVDYALANLGLTPIENAVVNLYINGMLHTWFTKVNLKPGETNSSWFASGWHDGEQLTYSMVADPDNKIVEADETNNLKVASIIVVLGKTTPDFSKIESDRALEHLDTNLFKLIKP